MQLFPKCEFRIVLSESDGRLVAGHRNVGSVELLLPENIERAKHLDFLFQSTAIAGYGSGKSRSVLRRVMFAKPLEVEMHGVLSAGRHSFPFALDLPPSLAPAYQGLDCSIVHQIDLRLDVDWAIDPTTSFVPVVLAPPRAQTYQMPITMRSPNGFHEEIALEITVDSTVLVQGDPVTGRVALRTGHAAAFDAVVLTLGHFAVVRMGRSDRRNYPMQVIRIPGDQLRSGQNVAFRFPAAELPPTQRNGFIDVWPMLDVGLDVTWWRPNRSFTVNLDVLPVGSRMAPVAASTALLGESRMTAVGRDLAARTGLRAGEPPVLVLGREGMIDLAVEDASRGSEIAAREIFTFPDLGLGARSRPRGILAIGTSLAPEPLAEHWLVQCDTPVPREALLEFFAHVLGEMGAVDELQLSDHRLSLRRHLATDNHQSWLAAVDGARVRARRLSHAIAALPFLHPEARDAWTSTALEEDAVLLPHLPAIAGIRRAIRVSSGEQREATCRITSLWDDEPRTRVDVDLDALIPPHAAASLDGESPDELVRAIRAVFSRIEVASAQHVVAIAPGFAKDPRAMLAGLDAILAWVLHARGERRVDLPYR